MRTVKRFMAQELSGLSSGVRSLFCIRCSVVSERASMVSDNEVPSESILCTCQICGMFMYHTSLASAQACLSHRNYDDYRGTV